MFKRHFMVLVLSNLIMISLFAQQTDARWGLDSNQAVAGQSLVLTLEIDGTDKFDPPNLSVPGVEITFQGGGPRNSTSIVSVNGRTTKTVTKSWNGTWSLKSSTAGSYRLDGQGLNIGGQIINLPALDWQVGEAQNDKRFILQQSLNQNTCIPGIEIEYTLVWHIAQSVQNPEFTIPILDNPELVPVENSFTGVTGDTFQIQYRGRVLTGVKSITQQGGQQFTTLTLRFKVKPAKSGSYDLSRTMVSFDGAVDSRQSQDIFGNLINQPLYRTLVAQAQPLVLLVKDLPTSGRPSPFSGLIGKLDLAWEGGQGAYSVGEPIRLTLKLSGVLNKPNLDLDHMVIAALDNNDFQVGPDLSATEAEGQRSFVFRARRPGKLVVPSMKLNYFDPLTERYGSTSTKSLVFNIGGTASTVSAALSNADEPTGKIAAGNNLSPDGTNLARMNPNGLKRFLWPPISWWAFGIPGLLSGIVLSLCALWRYSPRRLTALQRKVWKKKLIALSAAGGRPALEEGRAKIQQLLNAGSNWKEKLESLGHWEYLNGQIHFWDEAFFADSRDDEPWNSRWEELRQIMGAWK